MAQLNPDRRLPVPLATGVTTLHPGDVACAEQGARLETLLGSCVAIILTDPRRTVAAMCHVVHARLPDSGAHDSNTAFGEVALASMAAALQRRGITLRLCEAYVLGGGNMFPQQFSQAHVGDTNTRWALAALARDGVRVVLSDIGGQAYRRVRWTVGSGAPDVVAVQV
jgi:chemotaxis protein CheD